MAITRDVSTNEQNKFKESSTVAGQPGVVVLNPDGSSIGGSSGGGTEYTEGDTDASITGTAMMWEDGSDTLRAVSAAKPLPVTQATAQAATTDTITAKLATDAIQNGTTALTPKFAVIDAATSGDNTLLAAVASKKIRVLSLYLVSAGTVNVRFESGAGGTALSGQMNLVVNTGFVLPFNPIGWFETASNTLLNLELSAAVSVDGGFTYVEV